MRLPVYLYVRLFVKVLKFIGWNECGELPCYLCVRLLVKTLTFIGWDECSEFSLLPVCASSCQDVDVRWVGASTESGLKEGKYGLWRPLVLWWPSVGPPCRDLDVYRVACVQRVGSKRPNTVHGGRSYFGGPALGPLAGNSRYRLMRAAAAAGRLPGRGTRHSLCSQHLSRSANLSAIMPIGSSLILVLPNPVADCLLAALQHIPVVHSI